MDIMEIQLSDEFDALVSNMESTLDEMMDSAFKEDAEIELEAATNVEDAVDVAHSKEIEDIVNTALGAGLINDRDIDSIDKGAKVQGSIDDDARKGAKDPEVKKYAKELMESNVLTKDEVSDIMNGESLADILNIDEETDLKQFDLGVDKKAIEEDPFEEESFELDEDLEAAQEEAEDELAEFFTEDSDEDLDDDDDEDDDYDDDDVEDSIPTEGRKVYHDEDDDKDTEDVTVSIASDESAEEEDGELFDEDFFDDEDTDSFMEMELNSIKPYNSFEGSGINAKQKGPEGFLTGTKGNPKDEGELGNAPAKQDTLPNSYMKDSWWNDIDDPSIDDMD